MNHRLTPAFLAWCVLAWPAIPSQAECAEACAYRDRGDRSEGLVTEGIVGGSFYLQGLHYQPVAETAAASEQLHLTFWLPSSPEAVAVEVWQPDRQYRMKPAPRQYGEGRQQFAWPRGEVIDRIGLSIDALGALIRAGDVYIPAVLSTHEVSEPAPGYAFHFNSDGGIDADCTIVRHEPQAPVVRRFECFEAYGGTLVIEWDGHDDRGQPVPGGVYVLEIDGDMLVESLRSLSHSVPFWHRDPDAALPPKAEQEEGSP